MDIVRSSMTSTSLTNLLIVGLSVSAAVCRLSLATGGGAPPPVLWLLRVTERLHHLFGPGHRQQVEGGVVEVGAEVSVQICSLVSKPPLFVQLGVVVSH